MNEDKIIRRCTRLLAAIHELHKQGYQNLAVHTGKSSSGFHWRLSLLPFNDMYIDEHNNVNIAQSLNYEEVYHSSGQTGNEYFGWTDTAKFSARELAQTIKERFPRLLAYCKGTNFEYVGWYSYMLGEAEKDNLPVMYQDYHEPTNGFIATTGEIELLIPPHNKMKRSNGRQYCYIKPPFLSDKNRDWHFAYKSIIESFRSSEIAKSPLYPIETGDLFEVASYWEGAIYYIQNVLGFNRIDELLNTLDGYSQTSERWSSFFAIWDNFGQFVYLKAFLIRQMLNEKDKYSLSKSTRNEWQCWLDNFELHYGYKQSIVAEFHNPYFGGNNPLHLGGILESRDNTQESRLIKY